MHAYHQPYAERVKPAGRRRLSSPIINPNFEEDFDASLTTMVNMEDVLASLTGLTLTSSAGHDELLDINSGWSVDRDDSWVSDSPAAKANYKEHEEVLYTGWPNKNRTFLRYHIFAATTE